MNNEIKVWRFQDAPAEYQQLSTNGGDEDWLVYVPSAIVKSDVDVYGPPSWVYNMDAVREPQEHLLEDGAIVFIASHS